MGEELKLMTCFNTKSKSMATGNAFKQIYMQEIHASCNEIHRILVFISKISLR